MRYLPHHDLYEVIGSEVEYVTSGLIQMGYKWIQTNRRERHYLYDKDGQVCIGEKTNDCLYLDSRVREDLLTLMSGFNGEPKNV